MELDTGVIYLITNEINGKKYVGQAVSYSGVRKWGSQRRRDSHVKNALNQKFECRLLENAINKYGPDNFSVIDIIECGVEELNDYEQYYIEQYQTLAPNGYNLMTGGANGRKHSEETKKLMSETRTGKKHSQITKEKIGIAHKNKEVTEETKENIGKTSKYRNMSEDNKNRLQSALKNINLQDLPMYICLSVDKRNNRNVDVIRVRVPGFSQKQFSQKNMSLEEKIQKAIEYKNIILNGDRSWEISHNLNDRLKA